MKNLLLLCVVSIAFVFSACHDSEIEPPVPDPVPDPVPVEHPAAEILVYSSADDLPVKQAVADFALEQFREAQQGLSHQARLSFKFVDIDEPHFEAAASNYLLSGKYAQVIAPDDSHRKQARALLYTASRCFRNTEQAPGVILPSMTSSEIVRFAQSLPYVRILTSDARGQLSAALKALSVLSSTPYVFMLCSDEDYGETYGRFFKTFAAEAGFKWVDEASGDKEVNGLIKVKSDISRAELERTIMSEYQDFCSSLTVKDDSCLFFNFIVATDNPEHGLLIDSLRYEYQKNDPRIGLTEELLLSCQNGLKYSSLYHDATQFSLSVAPQNTDFANEFKKRFGRYPIQGEANFYDAVLVALYAEYARLLEKATLQEGQEEWPGAKALNLVLAGNTEADARWDSQGIRNALKGLLDKKLVRLHGASSDWNFDTDDNLTCTRRNYFSVTDILIEDDGIDSDIPFLWISSDISDDVWYVNEDLEKNQWTPEASTIEEALSDLSREIPDLSQRWALLIAGTKSTEKGMWGTNYRHQADVWNMFHLLRGHGYQDDHIIVITEDDIFGHQLYGESPDEKVVKRSHDAGEVNLYEHIPSHYCLSDLSQQDVCDIITGVRSDRLPYVIDADEQDNVFIYWSGHGNVAGELRWDGQNSGAATPGWFTPQDMKRALSGLAELVPDKPGFAPVAFNFRRLLFVVEACHSGKLIAQLPKTEGMLYLAAAESEENSWADDTNLIVIPGVTTIHRFDRFSSNFVKLVEKKPEISLSQLYEQLYNMTTDSHPLIYNNANYGSLNLLDFTDFRIP